MDLLSSCRHLFSFLVGWAAVLVVDQSSGLQIKYEDIVAIYEENQARLTESGIRIKWNVSGAYVGELPDLVRTDNATLQAALDGLPGGPGDREKADRQLIEMMIEWSDPEYRKRNIERSRETRWGQFEYSLSPLGTRLRQAFGDSVRLQVLDDSRFLGWSGHSTCSFCFPAGMGRCSSASTNPPSVDVEKCYTVFDIRDFSKNHRFALGEILSPFAFQLFDGMKLESPLSTVFPCPKSTDRFSRITVRMDGDIATVDLEEDCKNVVSSDGRVRTGQKIQAEIDLAKGGLPRVIRIASIGCHDGQLLRGLADSFWPLVYTVNLRQFENGAWYPERIVSTSTRLWQGADYFLDIVREKGAMHYWNRAVYDAPDRNALRFDELTETIEVIEIEAWSPEPSTFDLTPPADADRVSDFATGDFRISAAVGDAIALDLQSVPDELLAGGQAGGRWWKWAVWAALSIACFGLLLLANRRKLTTADWKPE